MADPGDISVDDLDDVGEVSDNEEVEEPDNSSEVEVKEKDTSESGDDEDEEDEDEERVKKEREEQEEEEEEPDASPKPLREIAKEYPGIFKKHPQLRAAWYRDKQYGELFGNPETAKIAVDKADILDQFEGDVFSGKPERILKALVDNDKAAFRAFVKNILPTVHGMDRQLEAEVSAPYIKNILRAAGRTSDKNLILAARHLSNFVFGTPDVPGDKDEENTPDPRVREIEEKVSSLSERIYSNFRNTTVRGGYLALGEEIDGLLEGNKGFNSLPEFTQNALREKIFADITKTLAANTVHSAGIDKLWERAARENFPDEWIPRLQNAFLGGARPLIAGAIRKRLAEAVGKGNSNGGSNPSPRKVESEKIPQSGGGGSKGKIDPKSVDWSKTSPEDFLNDKITFKKR